MSKDSLPGQLTITDYLAEKSNAILSCGKCICRNCLYWWSNRCSYGSCYDDHRAKIEPYDKMHPGKPPRTAWSKYNMNLNGHVKLKVVEIDGKKYYISKGFGVG